MQRMGRVIKLKPEVIPEYKRIHAAVWPEVLKAIRDSNIRNYTIFLKEPENMLFAYWEYHGTDFDADMKKMARCAAHARLVEDHRPDAGALRDAEGRRVVGGDGERVPHGLRYSLHGLHLARA